MEDLRLTSFEDFQDKNFGKIGTPERDEFEKEVDDALQAYRMGEVIKQARKARNLTQEQLGAKIGVQSLKFQDWNVDMASPLIQWLVFSKL